MLVTSEISIYLEFSSNNVVIARRHDEAIFKFQQAFYIKFRLLIHFREFVKNNLPLLQS